MKIGIDIGGSHIAIGLIDEKGNILLKKEKNLTKADKENMGKFIEETVAITINNILVERSLTSKDIEKIGIACPGTIKNGVIVYSNNLMIENLNIVEKLQRYFNIPIKIANDAKCAGMCEKTFGSLKDYDDAVFMCLGTGVGGAVFMDGKMLKPKRYEGLEIGHIAIEKNGIQCTCGRKGCLEKYASMKELRDKITERLGLSSNLNGEIIFELAKREQDKIRDIVEEFSDYLAEGIINIVNIFEPEAICIGGSYVYHTDILLDKLNEALSRKTTFNREQPKIVMAEYANDAGIIGATLLE